MQPFNSTAAHVRSLLPAPLAMVFLVALSELFSAPGAASKSSDSSAALAAALAREDLPAVHAAVAAERELLGDRAGEPEVPDEFRPVPKDATLLTRAEARRGFTAHFAALEKMRWWKVGVDPTTLAAPLRGPASVIVGNVAAVRARLDGSERSLAVAKDAAAFLLWTPPQAGSGGFPFPAARGTSSARAMEAATHFLNKAEQRRISQSIPRQDGQTPACRWRTEDLRRTVGDQVRVPAA